jgi:DNA-binding XRE family transcriptional regulator
MKCQLSKRDAEICARIYKLRECFGVTQTECARQIGIERGTFVNYESGRTPLKFDVALRLCRQFIFSEEWLATGHFDACREAAKKHGEFGKNGWSYLEKNIYLRQCMDLLSEPITNHITPGMLFSSAYDTYLAPRYLELVIDNYYSPRVIFNDWDNEQLGINLMKALDERFIKVIRNEALRVGKNPVLFQRWYFRRSFEVKDLLYRKFMGMHTDNAYLQKFAWLKNLVSNPDALVAPIEAVGEIGKLSKNSEEDSKHI